MEEGVSHNLPPSPFLTDALHASDLLPKMRSHFLASDVMRPKDDENTVWTDSQDYGADEILIHSLLMTER